MPRTRRQSWIVIPLLAAACGTPTEPTLSERHVPDVTRFVTSGLAGHLDSSGRFDHAWECSNNFNEDLTTHEVERFAQVFARDVLGAGGSANMGGAGQELSEAHGHEVDWSRARAGVRAAVCAEAPLETLPSDVHAATRNAYGPYYLVPIYVKDDQVAVLDVAANATIYLDESGTFKGKAGGEFKWGPSPHGHPFGSPLSAEAAVKIAAETTGGLVSAIPRLLAPGHRQVPHQARWEITLDRVVRFFRKVDGSAAEAAVLYVGLYPSFIERTAGEAWSVRLFVAAPAQPEYQTISIVYESGAVEELSWPIREDIPTDYWEVSQPIPEP